MASMAAAMAGASAATAGATRASSSLIRRTIWSVESVSISAVAGLRASVTPMAGSASGAAGRSGAGDGAKSSGPVGVTFMDGALQAVDDGRQLGEGTDNGVGADGLVRREGVGGRALERVERVEPRDRGSLPDRAKTETLGRDDVVLVQVAGHHAEVSRSRPVPVEAAVLLGCAGQVRRQHSGQPGPQPQRVEHRQLVF